MKELNKIHAVIDKSQEIGAFIDWLSSEGLSICQFKEEEEGFRDGTFFPIRLNIEQLLAKYFKIDLNKAEKERVKILENIRKQK